MPAERDGDSLTLIYRDACIVPFHSTSFSFSFTSLIKVQQRRKSHWNPLRKADRAYSECPSSRTNQLTRRARENKENETTRPGTDSFQSEA